jgi:hypothetical protein
MGFDVYKMICDLFLKKDGKEFIFARAFLCLEWNLMARLENVVHAHILYVYWDDDCLVFCFVKNKGDQMGWNGNQERHVYASPHNPEIFPVLALSCYIFTNPCIFTDEIEEQEDGAKVEAQGGVEQAALVLTKEAFSLEEASMSDLWIAFIIKSISIQTSCLHWVSCLAIWDHTLQGKVHAAMPVVAQQSLCQWSPYVFVLCGVWAT